MISATLPATLACQPTAVAKLGSALALPDERPAAPTTPDPCNSLATHSARQTTRRELHGSGLVLANSTGRATKPDDGHPPHRPLDSGYGSESDPRRAIVSRTCASVWCQRRTGASRFSSSARHCLEGGSRWRDINAKPRGRHRQGSRAQPRSCRSLLTSRANSCVRRARAGPRMAARTGATSAVANWFSSSGSGSANSSAVVRSLRCNGPGHSGSRASCATYASCSSRLMESSQIATVKSRILSSAYTIATRHP